MTSVFRFLAFFFATTAGHYIVGISLRASSNDNRFNNVADRYYGYNTNMARIFGSLFRHTLGDIGSNLR